MIFEWSIIDIDKNTPKYNHFLLAIRVYQKKQQLMAGILNSSSFGRKY